MRLLVLFLMLLSFNFSSAKCSGVDEQEGFPWPWATQCPFPWENIEGKWLARAANKKTESYFDFKVISKTENGEHYLIVTQYDVAGLIVARGVGYSRLGQMGVVSAMHFYAEDKQDGFWLHVSAFVEDSTGSPLACINKRLKTAVKITPFGQNQDQEEPLIIEKMIPGEED